MTTPEHLDVLVVGAGISGIGAGRYLTTDLPGKRFAILEAREASGGTWDLFRYPGVRSDSDLHTFGFAFKPWREPEAIADGGRILAYLREAIAENGLERRIRYGHRVTAAAWSSEHARWTVDVERTTGERTRLTADWLFWGGGYYRYDEGFTPRFEARERFAGPVVHPQDWPADLDVTGRRVVVIGSGATAVTLVPAMAGTAAHVTMLQRTPSYVMPVPRRDAVANALRRLLGDERGYALTRRKNIAQQQLLHDLCRRHPRLARAVIRRANARALPDGYAVDEHFNPPYDPWTQRLCAVPDADLFRAIRRGDASVVTDRIATFTESGLLLESGAELEADVVVTATGLRLQVLGGIPLSVDGRPVRVPEAFAFKGMMLSGVPNLAYAIGYASASWTLKVDLLCAHLCRLIAHLDATGTDTCVPVPSDPAMPGRPLFDLGAGYVQRAEHELPRQGDRAPWLTTTSYRADARALGPAAVTDPELRFERRASAGAEAAA